MDINRLFEATIKKCGRVLKLLPENEIGSIKEYLMDILQTETLPSLNEVYPYIKRMNLPLKELEPINDGDPYYTKFRVPLEMTDGLKIISLRSYNTGMTGYNNDYSYDGAGVGYLGQGTRMSAYPNKYGRYSSSNLYETVVTAQLAYLDLQLLGSVQEAPLCRFQPPNILMVYNSYAKSPSMMVSWCLENDKNLLTIPDSVFEAVRRLFILDVKSTIYSEYGMLSQIDTALGTIDLKIDDWSGAEAERNELFDNYKSMAHARTHTMIAG